MRIGVLRVLVGDGRLIRSRVLSSVSSSLCWSSLMCSMSSSVVFVFRCVFLSVSMNCRMVAVLKVLSVFCMFVMLCFFLMSKLIRLM